MGVVVVGWVPTPEGEAALDFSVEEARRREARLLVVHSHRSGRDDAEQVAAMRARLDADGVAYEVQEPINDLEPAEDLLRAAETEDAEVIVVGLRRRSPVGKLVLGSNAQRVLLDAPCPVLTVKAGRPARS